VFREMVYNSRSGHMRAHKSRHTSDFGSEPACPEAVLEGFRPSNTRRKEVLLGGRAETRWH